MEWASAVVLVLILFGSALAVSRSKRDQDLEAWLPQELHGAQLAYAEKTFKSTIHKLVAKLDRAYRYNGVITLIELKTRKRVQATLSDIIELSVQRIALRDATGEYVSKVAYVAVQTEAGGRKHVVRVDLLDTRKVVALRSRHEMLKSQQVRDPRPARSLPMCVACPHKKDCHARYNDRC